ncbi:hypothetical protein BKA70DRAFT_1247022 [Coprinopsis sp. MPI-PUGE-AT-0042]|nr:hypothetical protein BKA70DRAFT_1247022 [Coprinopsis sp. MPI-PUGE-AT-0042]
MPSDGRYTDPYAAPNTRQYYQHDSYDYNDRTGSRGGYPGQQQQDSYDPYNSSAIGNQEASSNAGQHRRNLSRSQSQRVRYTDEAPEQDAGPTTLKRTGGSTRTRKSESLTVTPVRKEFSGFEAGEKDRKGLKDYRSDVQGNLWTKGSRVRCFGRFFCCTLMITVLLVVSIILSLALWVRPPSVAIGDVVTHNTTGSLSSPDGLQINLSVPISVNNPSYLSVTFSQVKVEIFYPILGENPGRPVGGGEARDIEFKSGEETDFTFPFALSYKSTDDPGSAVFADLGQKCGFSGERRQNIVINYKLTVESLPLSPLSR